MTNRSKTPILLTLLLAAGLPQVAPAMIAFQAQPVGSPFELLEKYHKIGAKHPNVAGILVVDPKLGLYPGATGTLIGYSKDGSLGYLLTAAHPFFAAPDSDQLQLDTAYRICFSPQVPKEAKEGLQATPTRLIVHPGRTRATLMEVRPPFILESKSGASRNDLAILEFPATALRADLEKAGAVPAGLYGPEGYARTDVEARVVGFGFAGTTWTSGFVVDPLQVHGGNTTVSYATYGDRTGFYHWSPIHEMGLYDPASRPGGTAPYRFMLGQAGAGLVNPLDGSPASVRSAKFQVMTCSGDSGGPLFLNTKEGFKVAGICGSAQRADLQSAASAKPDVPCYLEHWEPLKDHLTWINGVLAGELGGARVLTFATGQEAKVGTWIETKADAGTETKAEVKAEAEAEAEAV
jgi:hypothetical protein